MLKKLSIRLSLAIICVMIIVLFIFTIYLANDRSRQLQQAITYKGITSAKTGATVMGKMFDTIIDNGFFTLAEVFDRTLVPIELPEKIMSGYDNLDEKQLALIQKYHYRTGLDSYLDNAILEIQDQFLQDPQVIYAALLDLQGYLPTHNSKYNQRLAGDYFYDLQNNRTKRVFKDEASLVAIKNKDKPYTQTTYHRDTGEIMHDFSAPVYVKGEHWGVFRIGFNVADMQKSLTQLKQKIIIFMGILLIILVVVVGQITNIMMRPLGHLHTGVQLVAKGDLSYQQPVTSSDEVGDLARAFNKMVNDLKTYIQNLTETTAAKEKIESELKIAHDIQMGIIPKIFPPYPNRTEFDIHATIIPAREVGGDFYDFFLMDENNLCIAIGDVSGKGVPASLLMAVVATLLRAKTGKNMTPSQILNRINNDLCIENKNNMFVTIFLGILEISTGEFTYSNGGHNIPFLFHHDGRVVQLENTKRLALGIKPDFEFGSNKIKLYKNDGLFLYTDGVTEATNREKNMFSEERLQKVLETVYFENAEGIEERIENEVKLFVSTEPQFDDITHITLKYLGTSTTI